MHQVSRQITSHNHKHHARRLTDYTVRFCDHPFEGYEHEWHSAPEGETYGRTYRSVSPLYQGKTWLCPVTLYVLGHYPKHIYIQQL